MPGTYQAVYNASKSFVQSFALALRKELKDTDVTVTSLMPGPTDTEFFERADMLDTKVGAGEKDDPADVARDGFEALMDGEERVVSASMTTKLQGAREPPAAGQGEGGAAPPDGRAGVREGLVASEDHEVLDAEEAEGHADRSGHEAPLRVAHDLRIRQADAAPAGQDLAPAGRDDVADPLALAPVGQRDDMAVAVAEDVHRDAVGRARTASDVREDRKAGQVARDVRQHRVRDLEVEAGERARERHPVSVAPAPA